MENVTIAFELEVSQADALAELCKRICWTDMRSCAVDDDEAYQIRSALDRLRTALADQGFAPR